MSLTAELLEAFEFKIESVLLIPSRGGRFEVSVDDELVYSKLATGRHAEPGEIKELLAARLG